MALLDHASRSSPRGSVEGIDAEEIAVALEFDPALIETALLAFREKNMILPDGRLADWDKNQKLSTPRTTRARHAVRLLKETEAEPDAIRRQRLQDELLARHKRRGRTVADHFNPHTPEIAP